MSPLYSRHVPRGCRACAVTSFLQRCCWLSDCSPVAGRRARCTCRPGLRRRPPLLQRPQRQHRFPDLPARPPLRRRRLLPRVAAEAAGPHLGVRFTKMHGLGNDFVVLDARMPSARPGDARIRAMADRHTGIGFDQLLVIEATRDPACVAAYSIRNADGSVAEQCGNGARCIGAWLHRAGAIALGTMVKLQSPAGVIGMRLDDASTVTVEMGEPVFEPARIPFDAPATADAYPLDIDGERVEITAVSMGNPHAVMEVADVHDPRVDDLGPQ